MVQKQRKQALEIMLENSTQARLGKRKVKRIEKHTHFVKGV